MKSKVMLSVLLLTCMALCLNTVPAKAQTWELVTDASTLKAGDVLVIASNSKGTTAGDISSQIMASIASTFSDDKSSITTLGEGTVELTLGGTSGAWTLANNEGKLLGATAVKKLAWSSGTTTWRITISNNDATIQNGTSTYGRFLYNATSGLERFTTYTSNATTSMLLPQLYRKTGSSGGVTYTDDFFQQAGTHTTPTCRGKRSRYVPPAHPNKSHLHLHETPIKLVTRQCFNGSLHGF